MRPFAIALAAATVFASPAVAQIKPKTVNASTFVMQAWNGGQARLSLCNSNRWNSCAFLPEDRKVLVTRGATACVLEIQWPQGAKFRVDFGTAGVQRLAYEPDLPAALYIEDVLAATPDSERAYPEVRWLRVESGAMNDRVYKALRALIKGCRDKTLGF